MYRLTVLLIGTFALLIACGIQHREPKPTTPLQNITDNMVVIPAGSFEMGLSALRQNFDFLKPYVEDQCLRCDDDPENKMSRCPDMICQHTVYLDAFKIDKYEVTNRDYDECVKAGGCTPAHRDDQKCGIFKKTYLPCTLSPDDDDVCKPKSEGITVFEDKKTGHWLVREILPDTFRGEHQPVVCVDWQQATQYCEWKGRRLPTEAEWEKAAKGGKNTLYPWGDNIKDICQNANVRNITLADGSFTCGLPNRNKTTPVGSFTHNGYGLYDMIGNVAEWVSDWYTYNYYYSQSPYKNPQGPPEPKVKERYDLNKVIRGGSWADFELKKMYSFYREGEYIGRIWDQQGFRCAKTVE